MREYCAPFPRDEAGRTTRHKTPESSEVDTVKQRRAIRAERLEMISGNLAIESVPGKGTTVQAQIPLGKSHTRGGP